MIKPIRIGTRGSKLALYQANYVADLLATHQVESEIVIIDTTGDKMLDVAISKIGSKGVFTEELEVQLESGDIDIAVHSAKDMQSSLPDGFDLIAFTQREKPNDVIIGRKKGLDYRDPDQPLILGTSSTRRVSTLKYYYPHVKTVEIRGNLQTRISRMDEGRCDALLLAYAGVHRMGYNQMILHELSLDEFTPAVGQGTIAVEASDRLDPVVKDIVRHAVHDELTGYCLLAERAFLKEVEGGCSIPIFALGTVHGKEINLKGGIVSLDGDERISTEVRGTFAEATEIGKKLAAEVMGLGGKRILGDIKLKLGK